MLTTTSLPVPVSPRIRDLEKEIVNGRFRQDLFYRLDVMQVQIPPLRDPNSSASSSVSGIALQLILTSGSSLRPLE